MSYCVNCGVELAPSEKSCPLCKVPVQNPASPWVEPQSTPYPKRVESIINRVDRRYGALLAGVGLVVPVLCSLLIDILMTHTLTWSGYVTGACLCLFVWVLLPMLVKGRHSLYLYMLYDELALQLYLCWICFVTVGIPAYLTLVLPLGLLPYAFANGFVPIVCSKKLTNTLYVPAIAAYMAAVLCVLIELTIDLNNTPNFEPMWSLIAAVPCIVIGVMLILIEGKKNLKDKIHRRLFI